jgi:tetratricopeptide (TPR) repeat protein
MSRLAALLLVAATLVASSAFAQGTTAPSAAKTYGSVQLKSCEEAPEPEPQLVTVEDVEDEESSTPEVVTTDGSSAAGATEIEQFFATAKRFRERTDEFAFQVTSAIERNYAAQVKDLREQYDRLVGKADIDERMLREKAIEAHERFIGQHESSPYTPRRMFRLAELYFESAEEIYLADNEKYEELATLFDQGKLEYLPEPPKKDFRRSIALYKKVIQEFPDYEDIGAVYYMLGYAYSDETSRNEDSERARETYQALVDNVPDSGYRPQAFFRLADLYFEENQLDRALYFYQQILDEFDKKRITIPDEKWEEGEQRLYELALYKVAWAYYKRDDDATKDLAEAVRRFTELIEWAEKREARTGSETDLKPESVRYLAIALADLTTESGTTQPMAQAMTLLERNGERPWTFGVLAQMASVLVEQARFVEAIDAYERLQARYPLRPEGPEFANTVVVLYRNLPVPDPEGAAQARVELTNRYGLNGAWFEANKNNKDAIAAATQHILSSLQWVAYSFHDKANKSGQPTDYLAAAQKYQEYLERYPFAKNAYELNYYLAECYFGAQQWAQAIEQYERLFGYPEKDYQKEAIAGITYSYNSMWKQVGGDVTTIPGALANLKPALGEKVEYQQLPLGDIDKKYIASVSRLRKSQAEHPDLPVFLYDVGQIYYFHNMLVEARATFEDLLSKYPQSAFASSAAGQIVDSYLYSGQLAKMREAAARFAALKPGAGDELASARLETFATLERQGLFKEGELAYAESRFPCAVEAFEAYYRLYGAEGTDKDPKNVDLVLYNVAQAYSKLGDTTRSNEYFEKLIQDFPHSEQAPSTFWKMASNYERVLKLDRAVRYYEDLVTYHPQHQDAASAMFNAAFLKVGMKQFAAAASTYERYHDTYPAQPDAKDVLYRAAELYETSGDRKNAGRVYKSWLDKYGTSDADQWVETQKKLADFAYADGKTKDGDKLMTLIKDSYPQMKSALRGMGIRIAAEQQFKPIKAEYEEYAKLVFTGDQTKDAQILTRKAEWNVSLAQAFDGIVTEYNDFEWQCAALYYKGLTYQNHAKSWNNAPIPKEVEENPDAYDVYVTLLQKQAAPLENKAVESFKAVIDFAKLKKRHNPWVDKALVELNSTDPNTYPVYKPEKSTVIQSDTTDLPPAIETIPETARRAAPTGPRFAALESRR